MGLAPSQAWGQEQPSPCGIMVPGVVSRRDQGVGVREGPLLHGPGGQDWVGFGVGRPLPSLWTMVVVLGHTCSLWAPLFNPYGGHTTGGDVSSTSVDGEIEAQSPQGPCPAPYDLRPSQGPGPSGESDGTRLWVLNPQHCPAQHARVPPYVPAEPLPRPSPASFFPGHCAQGRGEWQPVH